MEKAIIRSLNPSQTIWFNASVEYEMNPPKHASDWAKEHAGKTYHITQDYQVYCSKEQKENMPAWSIRFDTNRSSFFIEWESNSNKEAQRSRELAVKHLSYHKSTKPLFGEPNTNLKGEPFFTLELEGVKNTYLADLNDKKFAIYEKFREMQPSEKRDCAFYYGLNATGLKHSELIAKMADFETGKLMLATNKIDGMNIMDHFLQNYGKEHITVVKMITEKAIVYNQIQRKENGLYMGEQFIATTPEGVYDYLIANKEIQKFLMNECANLDKSVEDDMGEREEVVYKEVKNLDELQKWRELGIRANTKLPRVKGMDKIKNDLREKFLKKGVIQKASDIKKHELADYEELVKQLEEKEAGLVEA